MLGGDVFQRVLATLTEYQDILTGITIGIGFSLAVTYWPLLKAKLRRVMRWMSLFTHMFRMSLSGDVRLVSGGTTIPAGEISSSLPLDATIRPEKARVVYENNCPAKIRIVGSHIYFSRRDKDTSNKLTVDYEIWGRYSFFGAMKKYWRMGYFDLLEDVERWHQEHKNG